MKIKTAIYNAAMFLQLSELCEAIEKGETPGGEAAAENDRLLRCANLVLGEIASDYVPLRTSEEAFFKGGELMYKELSRSVIDVFAVRNKAGASLPLRLFYDRIVAPKEGRYTVEYSYMPDPLTGDDEIPYTERVSARVLGYGIACEYCIVNGMTDDALMWDKRFKDALHLASVPKNERRVAGRGWL